MEQFSLINYLKNNIEIDINKFNYLKYTLEKEVYYYSNQFKSSTDKESINFETFKLNIKTFLIDLVKLYSTLKTNPNYFKKTILSNASFNFDKELKNQDFHVLYPVNSFRRNATLGSSLEIFKSYKIINSKLKNANFNDLISNEFLECIDIYVGKLTKYYKSLDLSALIVSNDVDFFEQINISIFENQKRPSFIFLHGLPGIYHIPITNYVLVWGNRIKDNFINAGYNSENIFVVGHPYYQKKINFQLRNSLNNILVLSKPMSFEAEFYKTHLFDRGNCILYLLTIEKTLRLFGVKNVRLRLHPSENLLWYNEFINRSFFIKDDLPLSKSLVNSTLVIGPTSTVFLESIYYGVNFLIYEPSIDNIDMGGNKIRYPFDGSNPKVPVAKNETELKLLIKDKILIDGSIFNEFIDTPFNLKPLISLI